MKSKAIRNFKSPKWLSKHPEVVKGFRVSPFNFDIEIVLDRNKIPSEAPESFSIPDEELPKYFEAFQIEVSGLNEKTFCKFFFDFLFDNLKTIEEIKNFFKEEANERQTRSIPK